MIHKLIHRTTPFALEMHHVPSKLHVSLCTSLTISGHAHGETLLKAAVLAAVAVHAHDETVFILHAHLVVDILLNAASEETLEKASRRVKFLLQECDLAGRTYPAFVSSPCNPHRRGHRNGTQMQCPRTPYTEAPSLLFLWRQRHVI